MSAREKLLGFVIHLPNGDEEIGRFWNRWLPSEDPDREWPTYVTEVDGVLRPETFYGLPEFIEEAEVFATADDALAVVAIMDAAHAEAVANWDEDDWVVAKDGLEFWSSGAVVGSVGVSFPTLPPGLRRRARKRRWRP